MKKRSLASLLIVSVIAIAAVFGVVFAFKNSGRQKDVYGSVTLTVDKPNIDLQIEIERDKTTDNGFRIIDGPESSAYFTITVGGLPDTASRRVELNESSISSGTVKVVLVSSPEEAAMTGVNTFKVTGLNGGAPTKMVFTTVSGAQTIAVNVNVKMAAKDMEIAKESHFALRQGGDSLNLMSADVLNKFTFFAHPEDYQRVFTPNNFPVEYRLKEQYPGVILQQGAIAVTDEATCVDDYIIVQAKLPAMTEWLDVPFYVFPAVNEIQIKTPNAYKAVTTGEGVWDLIKNRSKYEKANFEFSLDCEKSEKSDYGFSVTVADPNVVRVEYKNQYARELSAGQYLGEVAVNVVSYPIIIKDEQEISFDGSANANVQISKTFYIRVRNEFYSPEEVETNLNQSYVLASNKATVNAFYYEERKFADEYFDTFILDTANGKAVNFDSDIEFELDVEYPTGKVETYGWDKNKNPNKQISLYNILNIGYWASENDGWVMLSESNHSVNYLNRFRISFMGSAIASDFLSEDLKLTLRAKSIYALSNKSYASCEINLDAVCAIDDFKIENLAQFADGSKGIALVYDVKNQVFSTEYLDVYGMIAGNDGVVNNYSKEWNPAKVIDDRTDLPFVISTVSKLSGNTPFLRYMISASNINAIEYYKDYPLTIEYSNGKSLTFNIRVYPTVENLSMAVVSYNNGHVYKTISYDNDGFDLVRTAYVRKGHTYEFSVNTDNINVGAYAMFNEVRRSSGDVVVNTTSNMFDARELDEGIYECRVSLHAYSDSVYADKATEFTVYMVVVDPISSVTLPANVVLNGINDSADLIVNVSTLKDANITDFSNGFLKIDIADPVNKNIYVESGDEINEFKITAKFLIDDAVNLGFKVYKEYNFPGFDLDGHSDTANEPFVLNYIGGALVTTEVSINNKNPNKIEIADDNKEYYDNAGNYYLTLTSYGQQKEVLIKVADNAKNTEFGLACAEWKNGKYELSAFNLTNKNAVEIPGWAAANINEDGKVVVSLIADEINGVASLGAYALVVYASDSLYYAGENNGQELVLPKNYALVSLYMGDETKVENKIQDLKNNVVHDANSGKVNSRGGYNWILPAKNSDEVAALFYTPAGEYGSEIEANVYYLDDLHTVLGWSSLENFKTVTLTKYVNGIPTGEVPLTKENNRFKIDLNALFGSSYCKPDTTIYFVLNFNGVVRGLPRFYVVEAMNVFELESISGDKTELVSNKTLSADEQNTIYNVPVQRGNNFDITSSTLGACWQLNKAEFVSDNTTNLISYAGGTYTFYPYLEVDDYTFDLDALKSTVNVNVRGGVKYLNISQDSITLDGVTSAVYDITVRTDESVWHSDILNYAFSYAGVYYDLFDDENITSINMEGGMAKLEFKLTCLNATKPAESNGTFTYYLKIEAAVVITVPGVDPFYDFSGARLYVEENLVGSPLLDTETQDKDSADLNLFKQGVDNITIAHFADTKSVESNKSAVSLVDGQTSSGVIYVDDNSVGGILTVYPTPYYINVANISLVTSKPYTQDVLLGNDFSGKPIYDTVTYTIGFTQMVYNEDQKFFQPYIIGGTTPKMVSSWSQAGGYKWEGKYYFKTSVICDSYTTTRLSSGAEFDVSVAIQGENNAKPIVEKITLIAKYKNNFVITPDDGDVEDFAVCTMQQTQYQALGTTAVYDIALPSTCIPNYANFTFNGASSTTKTIDSKYAVVTIDTVAQTLSVNLKSDINAIGEVLEIRIPYQRSGDYVNPYLSIVIVPVYFELSGLEVANHFESRLQLASREQLSQLKFNPLFNYNTALLSNSLTTKMNNFTNSLQVAGALDFNYETAGEITVEFGYAYVGGVPVLAKNGVKRFVRTFYYDIIANNELVERTEYLAVGTSATYVFEDCALRNSGYDIAGTAELKDFFSVNVRNQGNKVEVTVSLKNTSADFADNIAYRKLIEKRKLEVEVLLYSYATATTQQLKLTIVPVWFTFNEFKLKQNPVNPLVALTTPTVLTVEAGDITCAEGSDITNAINAFNAELLNAQNNLANTNLITFSRVANDNGILNFNFDAATREMTRADGANPISVTSYLLVAAGIKYVNGIPTLDRTGNRVATYFSVQTFGNSLEEDNNDNTPELEPAPQGRTRTIAQAISTSVRYNIALPGLTYDSRVDKIEILANGETKWNEISGWNAVFNYRESVVTVTLTDDISLFNKVLTVMAYDRDGEIAYQLNIIPAYFTVEQIILADHVDEVPVLIQSGSVNWLNQLSLSFATNYASSNPDIEAAIEQFNQNLNSSNLVSRIDDSGYITLFTGVNYVDGLPQLTTLVNAKIIVQNAYRYVLVDGIPETTKVQVIGNNNVYNVNRTVAKIQISTEKDAAGNDIWSNATSGNGWSVTSSYARHISVNLNSDSNLIGKVIRIRIFVNESDVEPSYILNVIPAYFTVENITVAGQSSEDRNIFLYYGSEIDSPDDILFEGVFGEKFAVENIEALKNEFNNKLQGSDANLIGRYYDAKALTGDLHVTLYLSYENGKPTLVSAVNSTDSFVVRLDSDFTYKTYGKTESAADFPAMPAGPRTRTEIQAVGTTVAYAIDLNKNLTMETNFGKLSDDLIDDIRIDFDNNVVTIGLPATSDDSFTKALLANDLVLNFYEEYNLAFVLTIQPVLFEVTAINVKSPEQPAYLKNLNINEMELTVSAKYNDAVMFEGVNINQHIQALNAKLKSAKGSMIDFAVEGDYLKFTAAIDYGVAGSNLRHYPSFINVESNPLDVIESYVKYTLKNKGSTASYNQAVGTTEYYYLGLGFEDATVTVEGASGVVAQVLPYDGENVLKVTLDANRDLVGESVVITIHGQASFTMTINVVWFLVDGFEVVNHPERHLWLIVSDTFAENVNDLLFRARARHTFNEELQAEVQLQIDNFNDVLAAKTNYLEIYTIASEYVVVRGAIEYSDGVASIVAIDEAQPTQIVRDVFKYARYSDKIDPAGLVRPNIPRNRTVEITVGKKAVYTIDFPELSNFNENMIALFENDNAEFSGDDSKLKAYTNGEDGWTVWVNGENQLCISLAANVDLVERELKVFIYYDESHVQNAPNSFDVENVAFILTIRPVLFKVVDFAIYGYSGNEINVASVDTFLRDLAKVSGGTYVLPVFEYAEELIDDETVDLKNKMDEFTTTFKKSGLVSKTNTRDGKKISYYQVMAAVGYNAFEGTPVLLDIENNAEYRITKNFKINTVNNPKNIERIEYQAIGSSKTYFVDDKVVNNLSKIASGENYTVEWNQNNKNYVTVTLAENVSIENIVNVQIGELTLKINPVYYEVLGFETVDHPERGVWVVAPYTTEDLIYRVITTDITKVPANVMNDVQDSIALINQSLNNGAAPVSISKDSSQAIIISAAVNYVNGYPEIVEINKDKRNVVESIIPYSIWSASLKPNPENPTVVGKTEVNQVIGASKLYSLKDIRGQVFYQFLRVENAGNLVRPFENSLNGTEQVYERLTLSVDTIKGTLKVQLAADKNHLSEKIRIYLPYLTSVNGKNVWYSYCIEITPLLYELKGWTIEAANPSDAVDKLIQHQTKDSYLLLTQESNEKTTIKYVAKIYTKVPEMVESYVETLEKSAANYIQAISEDKTNVNLDRNTLYRYVSATTRTDNYIALVSYIVYENGIPKLVQNSQTRIENEIIVSTGYAYNEWNEKIDKELALGDVSRAVQAIGTTEEYMIEMPTAGKVFAEQITLAEKIVIEGERSDLVTFEYEELNETNGILKVKLAPVVGLSNHNIQIKIPYAEDPDALEPEFVFSYYITPVLYKVEGFYLTGNENNYVELENKVALELNVDAYHVNDVNVRSAVKVMKQAFESEVNLAIRNGLLSFNVTNANNEEAPNINLSLSDKVWIQKVDNKYSSNTIDGVVQISYVNGVPTLNAVNSLTSATIPVQIQVSTVEVTDDSNDDFPGWGDEDYTGDKDDNNQDDDSGEEDDDNISEDEDDVIVNTTPVIMGSTEVQQSIGTTKSYTLANVKGQILYQELWVENAGEIISSFESSLDGTMQEYELLAITYNDTLDYIQVQLAANEECLSETFVVYLPYLTTVNGKSVKYRYCIEITPLLFELKGWTIEAADASAAQTELIKSDKGDNYLLLTAESKEVTRVKYVAKIKSSQDANLATAINNVKKSLESLATTYVKNYNSSSFIELNSTLLTRNIDANAVSNNDIELWSYVEYVNGIPTLVNASRTLVSSRILISTGYSSKDEWEEEIKDIILAESSARSVQVIGTTEVYMVEIPDAAKIFKDEITVVNKETGEAISLNGVQGHFVDAVYQDFYDHISTLIMSVEIAAELDLRNVEIEVRIPYASNIRATAPEAYFAYYITPVAYKINGFYLESAENNRVNVTENSVAMDLRVNATYADVLADTVKNWIGNFESDLNLAIKNGEIKLDTINIVGGINVLLDKDSDPEKTWIKKYTNKTAENYIKSIIHIGYNNGIPELGSINPLTDFEIDLEIYARTVRTLVDLEDDTNLPTMGIFKNVQIVGSTQQYSLTNIKDLIHYQDLWLENVGNLLSVTVNNDSKTTLVYEKGSVIVDPAGVLTVQLAADVSLSEKVYVYLPFTTQINGKNVKYTYCLEITPVLFKLTGWTIDAYDSTVAETQLVKYEGRDDILLLTQESKQNIEIKYVARIESCNTTDPTLFAKIAEGKAALEKVAADYIGSSVAGDNIALSSTILRRINDASYESVNFIDLWSYIVYQNGLPTLIKSEDIVTGISAVRNQISIITGYSEEELNDVINDNIFSYVIDEAVQQVGSDVTHSLEIKNAEKVFANEIVIVDAETQESLEAEIANYVTVECVVANDATKVDLKVNLGATLDLCGRVIEIKIPFAESANALKADYYYSYCITPVAYIVKGLYLDGIENNVLELTNDGYVLKLHVLATYTQDAELRGVIEEEINKLEADVNDQICDINFNLKSIFGSLNVGITSYQDINTVLIKKIKDATSRVIVSAPVVFGYENGMPKIGTVNALNDNEINFEFVVVTKKGESITDNNGADVFEEKIEKRDTFEHVQPIGTTRNYELALNNPNLVFYENHIKVWGATPTANGFEELSIDIDAADSLGQNLTLKVTFKAGIKSINSETIDIGIPFKDNTNGESKWCYYLLRIKPVLYVVKGWQLEIEGVDGKDVNSVALTNSSVEFKFVPVIDSAELNVAVFGEDLQTIKASIKKLEDQINTYDPAISDGYTYMVINSAPRSNGSYVNYTIYRDGDKSYLRRDTSEASITDMTLSAYISYDISDLDSLNADYVSSASAVTQYGNTANAYRVESKIEIITADESLLGNAGDNATVFITQENANRLLSLSENVNYVLMSDIYLDEIKGLENGWKPVDFPKNATLDGNNRKIFFNKTGFDLSGTLNNIGLFTMIPQGSVVKNLQIVFEHGNPTDPITTLEVDLKNYTSGTVNIGMLAGVNNGIVTNSAVLSEWQFNRRNLTTVVNPITGKTFERDLPFNLEGCVFDENYFYEIGYNSRHELVVTHVYNSRGHEILPHPGTNNQYIKDGEYYIEYDVYHNVKNWINPDRTSIANYTEYSAILPDSIDENTDVFSVEQKSAAKLFVKVDNTEVGVVLGGLIGANNNMVTNSRVLIDVELYGDSNKIGVGEEDESNILSSSVGGMAGINSGTITTSFFRDGSVINNAKANSEKQGVSLLGGFVARNSGIIQQSYAMGGYTDRDKNANFVSGAGVVKSIRNSLGGFVHTNSGTITDCLINMVILKTGTEGSAGGFVYENTTTGKISNSIENNFVILQSESTFDYYAPFAVIVNGKDTRNEAINTNNLSNLIYAGNTALTSDITSKWNGVLKRLDNHDQNKDNDYSDIRNYAGFSMGNDAMETGVSANNTIWKMTEVGPMLREANNIAISHRKYAWKYSPYLYNPGTAENPYLVWTENQFNDYVYGLTPNAVEADKDPNNAVTTIESNYQSNHLRLVDNVELSKIKNTYKIIYTGTFEGNGLTMSGIQLDNPANKLPVMGLFGKTEYATIRNINFKVGDIKATVRYVGGIAGIAINTSFVDVDVTSMNSSNVIQGANIVGGFVGLNVVNDASVENYNLHSSVSASAIFKSNDATDEGANFENGREYVQQTLYSRLEYFGNYSEQGFGTAGAVFGFVTSNPNNYREGYGNNQQVHARNYEKTFKNSDVEDESKRTVFGTNTDASWFLKDKQGNVINNYFTDQIVLYNVSGAVKAIKANVAGGLIGIMDETIELNKPKLISLDSLTGKYYLGGIVGINLGKISGEANRNGTYSAMNLADKWNVYSWVNGEYIFRNTPDESSAKKFWGMTVGAIAGYNDGIEGNNNSGVIENINVNANVLKPAESNKQYVIGGVVGANGTNGVIDNSINLNDTVRGAKGNQTSSLADGQANNIGYYFGQIVGQSNDSYESANPKMTLVLRNINAYVSSDNFKTPNDKFNVEGGKTHKVQTMTLEEYKKYLADNINSFDLKTRVEMLENWLRSIPTLPVEEEYNNGYRYVEKYDPVYKNELLSWAGANGVFNKGLPTALQGKAYNDYVKYIEYSAISEAGDTASSFADNLAARRQGWFKKAMEFFTYKQQVSSKGIAGVHNADFTWAQYEDYLEFKSAQYFDEFVFGEFGEDGNVYVDANIVRTMLNNYEAAKQFTNQDPLQVYLNYVVKNNSTEKNSFAIYIDGKENFRLNMQQYYYYMHELYEKSYTYNKINYTVKSNLAAETTNTANYVTYIYLNEKLSYTTSALLTIPEYIYMTQNELSFVLEKEAQWVKSGHRVYGATGQNDLGTRISDIGATTMWDYPYNENAEVNTADGVNVIYEGTSTTEIWAATTEYELAKIELGLTIEKYKEMIGLGGSLYGLITEYQYDKDTGAADEYIFALKAEQYGWTDNQQINFIKKYYETSSGVYDLQYALAATTYGEVIGQAANGNVRAVYGSNAQTVKTFDDGDTYWYMDNDGDGTPDEGDSIGVWYFLGGRKDTEFVNGDSQVYYFNNDAKIDLSAQGVYGAAMYVDVDGNKLFGKLDKYSGESSDPRSAGKDILIMHMVDSASDADFYQIEDGNKTYFKITRQIVENSVKVHQYEYESGNNSDYLEEALWWRAQGFTAEQFDKLKVHAMSKGIEKGYLYGDTNKPYTTRDTGFTLADDWYADMYGNETGFRIDGFTQAEYVEIVEGAKFVDNTWYSTFADYLLFTNLYYYTRSSVDGQNYYLTNQIINEIYGMVPNASWVFNNPFDQYGDGNNNPLYEFIKCVATQSELADAITFASMREAFLALFRAGASTADYIEWTGFEDEQGFNYQVEDNDIRVDRYFRLNHYIYYVEKNLAENSNFEPEDFKWVLNQDVRSKIYYADVTEKARTTDLVAYRMDWFNKGGVPFMTFRDYYEWINVFYYNDDYKTARGVFENPESGEITIDPAGWLTIDAYAVWKRMEKYENNVEYLAHMGKDAMENPITAPILKRQISTTVFPKVKDSGEYANDENGFQDTTKRVFARPFEDDGTKIIEYYGWGTGETYYDDYKTNHMDPDHQRHILDRYEYNEFYKTWDIDRYILAAVSEFDKDENGNEYGDLGGAQGKSYENARLEMYRLAETLINYNYENCSDVSCGGIDAENKIQPGNCQNPHHAAYQIKLWEDRYGINLTQVFTEGDDRENGEYPDIYITAAVLKLDEILFKETRIGEHWDNDKKGKNDWVDVNMTLPTQYAQLYIPYNNFEVACKVIMSYYAEFEKRDGYHNYMKYWARNGEVDWICNTVEYAGPTYGKTVVAKTYMEIDFWNRYNGTLSPLRGESITTANGKAYGW